MSGSILTKFNKDDSFFRSCIVGLLGTLNNKLSIFNVLDDKIEEVKIPFYYSLNGDERFMQDIFQSDSLDECNDLKTVEGNTIQIPSGIIRISSISFDTARMTNRFVRGTYTRIEDDELKTFNSLQNQIPISITIEVELKVDTQLDLLKITEELIKIFYKTHIYNIVYKGLVTRCQVGFPEEYSSEKPYEFSFGDDTMAKMNFNLEIETNYAIIDETKEFDVTNTMAKFDVNYTDTIQNSVSSNAEGYISNSKDGNSDNIPSNAKNIIVI